MSDGPQQAPASPSPFEPGSLLVLVLRPDAIGIGQAVITLKRGDIETRQGLTDAKGSVNFDKLTPGTWSITCEAGGMGRASTQPFKVGPAPDTVVVDPGPDGSDFTFVMTPPVGFLSVLVRDKQLKALAKVPVQVDGGTAVPTTGAGISQFGPQPVIKPLAILAGQKGAPTSKPFFTRLQQAAPAPIKFEPAESTAILSVGEVKQVPMQLEEVKLQIVKIDDHFAPSVETLDIRFAIKGLAKRKVVLTIEAENYAGKIVVQRDLGDGESADGENNLIAFTGKIEVGTLKDSFINPLMAPFKVTLAHEDADKFNVLKDEKPFKVLYHSLELAQGPWTPDETVPPAAKDKERVTFQLNDLGYWGGPVGKDTDDYLKKAVIRYKQNHKAMWQEFFAVQNDTITDALRAALNAGDNKRAFITGNAITSASGTSKLFVDAITYEKLASGGSEFGTDKIPLEKKRINRPLLPIEATLFVKDKAGNKKLAPEAVGECRISVHVRDPNEDLSSQFPNTATEPTRAKAYIELAEKLVSGRSADNGDNCPDTLNGIRKGPGLDFDQCFLLGDFYKPYVSAADATQKVVFTKACVDKSFPKRVGKACLYFRPSYVAGDDYKLTFEIDFTGLPNQAALEAAHGTSDPKKRIKVETGTFRVVRRGRLAAVVDWPARPGAPASLQLGLIAAEFAKAHIELDTGSSVSKTITSLITPAEFATAAASGGVGAAPAHTLSATKYFGRALPAQGSTTAAVYRNILSAAVYTNYAKQNFRAVGALIAKKIRATDPVGFIFVNVFMHEPVNILASPPTNNTVVKAAYITWGGSEGLADSTIMCDMKDPDKVYYVYAHEMGHNLFLLHHENAGDSPHAADHDTADHNCLMSYSAAAPAPAHQREGIYTPHLCGKCNLKLRGWDILGASMPAHS